MDLEVRQKLQEMVAEEIETAYQEPEGFFHLNPGVKKWHALIVKTCNDLDMSYMDAVRTFPEEWQERFAQYLARDLRIPYGKGRLLKSTGETHWDICGGYVDPYPVDLPEEK